MIGRVMKTTVIIIVTFFWAMSASANSLLDRYSDALKLSRNGQAEQAVADLIALYKENPQDKLADDILFQIGQIYEKRLGSYGEAIDYYNKLMDEHPRSKHSRRAEKAVQRLKKGRRFGDEVFREYNDILQNYQKIGGVQALKRMENLIQGNPGFVYAEKALLFIAQERLRGDDFLGAVKAYEDMLARFPTPRNKIVALRGVGQALIEARDFSGAKNAYKRLLSGDLTSDYGIAAGREGVHRVNTFLVMRWMFYLSLFIIAAYVIFMAISIPFKSVRPKSVLAIWPEFASLTLSLFGILYYLRNRGGIFFSSIFWLWFAGIIIALCNNLYIQNRAMSKYSVAKGIAAAFCVSLAAAYAIYYSSDLANVLWDSLIYEMEHRWR